MPKKRPSCPELRKYLVDLLREERSLEQLYRTNHDPVDLATVRAQWKASYRAIRAELEKMDEHAPLLPPGAGENRLRFPVRGGCHAAACELKSSSLPL